ncbi:UNVERIFIED_CONTAM: RNA polymerase II transcription factor B subunit 1 [Siphonaria sp. JEL0065]|nr:RNA polymerase II transcription factor B subunit 1 [Siphonaria sp. JEL0065]KAJ3024676.1 RNA polymerase II transcription factor B subunit 1 [Siphonaria sp. JEL0065]
MTHFQVQHKKKDGRLGLTATGLEFQATAAPDRVTLPLASVKSQAANVVSGKSGKVILKVSTAIDGDALNFLFVGKNAEADRTAFSTALASALANRPPAASAPSAAITAHDIQIRQALLMNPKNKHLAQLHRDLVISNIISENDFWMSRQELLVNQDWASAQKKGKSSASLVDVVRAAAGSSNSAGGENDSEKPADPSQPQTTVIKFTPEIIHSIFVQSPAVQLAYEKYVPEKLSEREFWTKYYTSKAFHALKAGKLSSGDSSEIFSEGEKDIDDDLLPIPKKQKRDPSNKLLDLSSTMEDHLDYGNAPDTTMKPGSVKTALPIIRRLNRHSTIVLKSAGETVLPQPAKFYQQETILEDLLPQKQVETRQLNILQAANYFGGVVDGNAGKSGVNMNGIVSASLGGGGFGTLEWEPNLIKISVNPAVGGKIFSALNKASLKRKVQIPTCKDSSKHVTRDDIAQIQSSASELLRHYWAFKHRSQLVTGETAVIVAAKLQKLREAIVSVYTHIVNFQQQDAGGGQDTKLLENVKKAMAHVCNSS